MKNRGMKRNSGYIGWRQRSKWKNQTSHSLNYRHINALTVSNTYPAISILAPAKGATGFTAWATRYFTVSIHAPTKGATLLERKKVKVMEFQSTLLRKERLWERRMAMTLEEVSIHAPTKGATPGNHGSDTGTLAVSIHAPTKGATYLDMSNPVIQWVFQSTLLRKERLNTLYGQALAQLFQSTLLRKERRSD